MRNKIITILTFLVLVNILIWILALVAFRNFPTLIATSFIAWGFGLRHAVDADHIAAIDNVTRKLIQDKKRPACVGLFFSLGHSTVVIIMTIAIILGISYLSLKNPALMNTGGIIGSIVSGFFLIFIAIINLIVFIDILKIFLKIKRDKSYNESKVENLLEKRGFFSRFFRPLYKIINKSWHMYPLGFIFGLGFDTATEIGILAIAASQTSANLNPWFIMIFPLLFTAGMTLIDTSNGILMLGAYGWAFIKPAKKLFYNMVITMLSLLIAGFIGLIELLSVLIDKLKLSSGICNLITNINNNFSYLGFMIISLFLISWLSSKAIFKVAKIEENINS